VQTDGSNIDIASIDIEKNPQPVSGIYRGNIEFYDPIRDALALSGVEEFINGRWVKGIVYGKQCFGFSSDYKVRPVKRVSGKAYFAVKKAEDGTKRFASAAYRAEPQYEETISDNVLSLAGGALEFENSSDVVKTDANTLVIKDGRLVDISAVDTLDPVKASIERSFNENSYLATILVSESTAVNGLEIYRGRIKSVDQAKSVTFESFALLDGVTWEFTNTPKTFNIDLSSCRFFEDGGIGNMREFDSSYVGKSVYVVANGTDIKLISDAPYAEIPVSGRIGSFVGGTFDDFGEALSDPTGVKLADAFTYSSRTKKWSKSADLEISIPENAIVMKNGKVGSISLLKMGDQIRMIRHEQSQDGILIICE
jgi:hypothetical protein